MIPKISLMRSYHFCAAHRLHTPLLSDDMNKKIYGKCNNPNGHGHNYTVRVTVRGGWDGRIGTNMDVAALDRLVGGKVISRFDHQHLNHDPAFDGVVTTGENLACFIWNLLVDDLPSGQLEKIGIVETRDNYFEFIGNELPVRGKDA